MLLRCDIAGRKTAYRPRSLSRDEDAGIRLRGLLPLRIGSVVEVPGPGQPELTRVSHCECSIDGLYSIHLEPFAD